MMNARKQMRKMQLALCPPRGGRSRPAAALGCSVRRSAMPYGASPLRVEPRLNVAGCLALTGFYPSRNTVRPAAPTRTRRRPFPWPGTAGSRWPSRCA